METKLSTLSRPWRFAGTSLQYPWKMATRDTREDFTPPWSHRGIWYPTGTGEYIVFGWKDTWGCSDYEYGGEIHRCEESEHAQNVYKWFCERDFDGVFLFKGYTLIESKGEPFPEELPGKWW